MKQLLINALQHVVIFVLCLMWGVSVPTIERVAAKRYRKDGRWAVMYGSYDPITETITLCGTAGWVTLLHEFGHHIQTCHREFYPVCVNFPESVLSECDALSASGLYTEEDADMEIFARTFQDVDRAIALTRRYRKVSSPQLLTYINWEE